MFGSADSLSQEEIDELYSAASEQAKYMAKSGWHRSRVGFRNSLFHRVKTSYVNKYYGLGRGANRGRRHYQHDKIARVFKKGSLFSFGVHLDKETAMLNKILDKVTDEHFEGESKAMFNLNSAVENMKGCIKELESANQEGEALSEELAKVPHFLETGKWE